MENKGWVVEGLDYTPPSGGDDPEDPDNPVDPDPDTPGGGDNPEEPKPEPEPDPTPDPEPEPDPKPEEVSHSITVDNPNEENPYVSDISAWRRDRYEEYDLKITSIPFDETRNVGLMIGTVGKTTK